MKRLLASSFQTAKITPALLELERRCIPGGYIRAINYHGTPKDTAINFEKQLAFYAEHFMPVSLTDLDMFFQLRRWDRERPGLIISFDDGLSSNYSVAAPLLEKYGFYGWFFVPVDFISAPPSEQSEFANARGIWKDGSSFSEGRIAMSWDELRDLDRRRHVIGCHSRTHRRMSVGLPDTVLEDEICTGKRLIEESLGHACACYCWVGGEDGTYTSDAALMIRKAGYKYSFTTHSFPIMRGANPHQLGRNNVESAWPLPLASFEVCGIQDLRYTTKRRALARIV